MSEIPCHEIIESLGLVPHPEGGFYKETYRSDGILSKESLPGTFGGPRCYSTAIFFLLRKADVSRFHRIKSDEVWFFHKGSPLEISIVGPDCHLRHCYLGSDIAKGQHLQLVVPAGSWFGARLCNSADGFSLVSCTVAPEFDFQDFELATEVDLEHWPAMRLVPELCPR